MGERLLFRPSVTPTKQGVELGRILATDTHSSRLQLTQRVKRNAKAFGSHRRSTRFHILIPGIKETEVSWLLLRTVPFSVRGSGSHLPGSRLFDPVLTVNFPTEWNLCDLVRQGQAVNSWRSTRVLLSPFKQKGRASRLFASKVPFRTHWELSSEAHKRAKSGILHRPKSTLIKLDTGHACSTLKCLDNWL